MRSITQFSSSQLSLLARLQGKVERLQEQIARITGEDGVVATRPVRKVSKEGRERLAKLARARWAKVKREGKKRL